MDQKDIAEIYVQTCLPMFSFKGFIVSSLTFTSLIHFEFISVNGVRECSSFVLLHVAIQFSWHQLLKRLYFLLHCIFLPPFHRLTSHMHVYLFQGLPSCSTDIFLFLYQSSTVFMTVALWYILKSGSLILLSPFFFLRIALVIWGLLCFHTIKKNFFYVCIKFHW